MSENKVCLPTDGLVMNDDHQDEQNDQNEQNNLLSGSEPTARV